MRILAIDPGPIESGWVCILDGKIWKFGKSLNEDGWLRDTADMLGAWCIPFHVSVERVASYGMSVGSEVFETCVWSGRFIQTATDFGAQIIRPTRKEIVVHLCGTSKAKDGNVRQAMIDRWGEPGTKKNPGPTFGMKGDVWQALAVATYTLDFLEGKVG